MPDYLGITSNQATGDFLQGVVVVAQEITGTERLKRTPLFDLHKDLKARMTDFGGWEMPVQYLGI
ncbi:MAG TPA: hypothetical protein V6D03_13030, partial [Candidatus Caenarcaniphilales bacterium]